MEVDSVISDLNHVAKEIVQTHAPVFGSLWPLSNAFLARLHEMVCLSANFFVF